MIVHEVGHIRTKTYKDGFTINGKLLDDVTLHTVYDKLVIKNEELAENIQKYLSTFDINKATVGDYGRQTIYEAGAELLLMQSKGKQLTSKQLDFLKIHMK